MHAISSTYRVQLHAGFTFFDLAARVPYLASLGISHVYLSPILQAAPGSMHGYDVVDHSRLSDELGGDDGWAALTAALRAEEMSAIVDVVPNHMALPTPAQLNRQWADVLRHGEKSVFASWFDIEWSAGQIVLPILGAPLPDCLARGEITVAGEELRYFDHVFPLAPGTAALPLAELFDQQHYRLAYWRTGTRELDYRRFFDVTTLIGLRVEDPEVFDATHRRLLDLVAAGDVTGLRIDHPDGLADPRGYLARLSGATDGTWTVVEKILEGEEQLQRDWPCEGTTGYDAMARISGLFLDPVGLGELTAHYCELTGEPRDFATVVGQSKRQAVSSLTAEVDRLVRLLARPAASDPTTQDLPEAAIREALVELLIAFGVYRAYVVPGEPASEEAVGIFDAAADTARAGLAEASRQALEWLRVLALGLGTRSAEADEFLVRFQQTCGPAMAKGVEDTAYYRWFPLASANEVGGDPAAPSCSPAELLSWSQQQQRLAPGGMTSLSTHDTKRSEDVRARLAVLSELPEAWADFWERWRSVTKQHRPDRLDVNTEHLLVQTLVGAWPLTPDRLVAYLEKATREAKRHTTWTEPDVDYDEALARFARAVLADPDASAVVAEFVASLAPHSQANVLGQKLLSLMLPGVPDVYQGTELVELSLVDPDNRRPVDFDRRAELLSRLDAAGPLAEPDSAKLAVVRAALRLRREHPEWFLGLEATLDAIPTTSPHAVAFGRSGHALAVVTRLSARLRQDGGWNGATVRLPPGGWEDALTGQRYEGEVELAALVNTLPVALLTRP